MAERIKILLIYTGGTIGMVLDHEKGGMRPIGFDRLLEHIPELARFDIDIDNAQLSRIVDSSDMVPELWAELAELIQKNHEKYDGFVILHGTDTLAFTASALSYMIQGLNKPIILTGSQLPIGMIRTDGKENLITAIEIAASTERHMPIISEVAVYFEYRLMRGNRVTKYSAEHFDAFHSPNYPPLAEAGIDILFHHPYLRQPVPGEPEFFTDMGNEVVVLKLFPGISEKSVRAIMDSSVRGIIMESFGSGNAPKADWFIDLLKKACSEGKIILNVTQCLAGTVVHGRYETSRSFNGIGIVSGRDLTFEAGVTKLMYALGRYDDPEEVKNCLRRSISGEMDESKS